MSKTLFVISRYSENLEWLKDYPNPYIIYNKGEVLSDKNIISLDNIGGNQKDICYFCYQNYNSLPDYVAFLQGNPFDHCKKEIFNKLINNKYFTPMEYYDDTAFGGWSKRDTDGGYMEINNSWYIFSHNQSHNQSCKYSSFDEFMNKYFEDYKHLDWIRFTPGSQYIVEKKQILQYPKTFWKSLEEELTSISPTEAHILERAMLYIFLGAYDFKK